MDTPFSDVNAAKLSNRQVHRMRIYILLTNFAGGSHLQSWFAQLEVSAGRNAIDRHAEQM
jgi:hypothetical protein